MTGSTTSGGRALGFLAAVLACTALVYGAVRGHGFLTYDDDVYVTANAPVLAGLTGDGIRWAFTEAHGSNWHPLTWLSHMVDVELFGLDAGGHHMVSLGLHLLNAVLLWLLLARLGRPPAVALFVTALFALHPLRVESVAWVSERKDVLSGAFFFGTLLAWQSWVKRPGPLRYALVALALGAGLMAKSMLVTVPFVLLLLDRWPLGRGGAPATSPARPGSTDGATVGFHPWREKLPLFALVALMAWVTLSVQSAGGATSSLGALSLPLRALNALASVGTYTLQSLWPVDLAVFYPHRAIVSEAPVAALLPGAALGALVVSALALAWVQRERWPFLFVGLAWFLGMLVPVLGLVQVGTQAHADRYVYLPLVGLQWALVEALHHAGRIRPNLARPLAAAGTLFVLALAFLTSRQVPRWASSGTLFRHALEVTESNYVAHEVLGEVHLAAGEYAEAERSFRAAVAIHPAYAEAHNNLGLLQLGGGDLDAARTSFELALAVSPGDPITLLNLGVADLESGNLQGAEERFRQALAQAPDLADAHFNLGLLEQRRGAVPAAEEHYRRAVALQPSHVDAWSNLGGVLLGDGRPGEALSALEEAVRLDDGDPLLRFSLGMAALRAGRTERAAESFRAALTLDPQFAAAASKLAELEGRSD